LLPYVDVPRAVEVTGWQTGTTVGLGALQLTPHRPTNMVLPIG